VEATAYGAALERRSLAAFDELRQSIKDIAFLSDPTIGELRLGCPESISAAILQPIIEQFTEQYTRVILDVDTVNTMSFPHFATKSVKSRDAGIPAKGRPTFSDRCGAPR
jgi:DNA-binding transcriptional LysR family regulator